MGKINSTNFDPSTTKQLDMIINQKVYYVDTYDGDDKNDGLTADTAFKTIGFATSKMNAKVGSYIRLLIRSGEYGEALNLYDLTTNLFIAPIDPSEGKVIINGVSSPNRAVGIYSPCYIANTNSMILINNIIFNPEGMYADEKTKLVALAYIKDAAKVSFNNCEFDGGSVQEVSTAKQHPVGIYAIIGGRVDSNQCEYRNLGIPVYASYGSIVSTNRNKFTNITDGYAATGGGIVSGIRQVVDKNLIGKAEWSTGYAIDEIEQSAIIETGSNENGSYIKYANGEIVLHYFNKLVAIKDMKDETGNMMNNRFVLTFPHRLTSIKSASMQGFLTNEGTGYLHKCAVRSSTVTNTHIYGFIEDYTLDSGLYRPEITRISPLTYTVHGRWKE